MSDELKFLIFTFLGLFVLLATLGIIAWAIKISQELKIINMEIKRTEGREQEHWRKKKRRLLFSFLPFV